MSLNDKKIDNDLEDIKEGTFGEKIRDKSKAFTNGAIIGGAVGLIISFVIGKRYILFTIAGIVGGGYIGQKFQENSTPKVKFKKIKIPKK